MPLAPDQRHKTEKPSALAKSSRGAYNPLKSVLIILIGEPTLAQTSTRVMTAHVPTPMAEKVDQLADRLERSRGWVVKQALAAWISQQEERDKLSRQALADVDQGTVVDHDEVMAWAASLSTKTPGSLPGA